MTMDGDRDALMHQVMDHFVNQVRKWKASTKSANHHKDLCLSHKDEIYDSFRQSGLHPWEFHTMLHKASEYGLVEDMKPLWAEVGTTFLKLRSNHLQGPQGLQPGAGPLRGRSANGSTLLAQPPPPPPRPPGLDVVDRMQQQHGKGHAPRSVHALRLQQECDTCSNGSDQELGRPAATGGPSGTYGPSHTNSSLSMASSSSLHSMGSSLSNNLDQQQQQQRPTDSVSSISSTNSLPGKAGPQHLVPSRGSARGQRQAQQQQQQQEPEASLRANGCNGTSPNGLGSSSSSNGGSGEARKEKETGAGPESFASASCGYISAWRSGAPLMHPSPGFPGMPSSQQQQARAAAAFASASSAAFPAAGPISSMGSIGVFQGLDHPSLSFDASEAAGSSCSNSTAIAGGQKGLISGLPGVAPGSQPTQRQLSRDGGKEQQQQARKSYSSQQQQHQPAEGLGLGGMAVHAAGEGAAWEPEYNMAALDLLPQGLLDDVCGADGGLLQSSASLDSRGEVGDQGGPAAAGNGAGGVVRQQQQQPPNQQQDQQQGETGGSRLMAVASLTPGAALSGPGPGLGVLGASNGSSGGPMHLLGSSVGSQLATSGGSGSSRTSSGLGGAGAGWSNGPLAGLASLSAGYVPPPPPRDSARGAGGSAAAVGAPLGTAPGPLQPQHLQLLRGSPDAGRSSEGSGGLLPQGSGSLGGLSPLLQSLDPGGFMGVPSLNLAPGLQQQQPPPPPKSGGRSVTASPITPALSSSSQPFSPLLSSSVSATPGSLRSLQGSGQLLPPMSLPPVAAGEAPTCAGTSGFSGPMLQQQQAAGAAAAVQGLGQGRQQEAGPPCSAPVALTQQQQQQLAYSGSLQRQEPAAGEEEQAATEALLQQQQGSAVQPRSVHQQQEQQQRAGIHPQQQQQQPIQAAGAAAAVTATVAAAPAGPEATAGPVLTYAQKLQQRARAPAAKPGPASQPRIASGPRTAILVAAASAEAPATAAAAGAGAAGSGKDTEQAQQQQQAAGGAAGGPVGGAVPPAQQQQQHPQEATWEGGSAPVPAAAGAGGTVGGPAAGSRVVGVPSGGKGGNSRLPLTAKLISAWRQQTPLAGLIKLLQQERLDLQGAVNERIKSWLTQDCDRPTAECLVLFVLGNLRRDWHSNAKSPGAFLMGMLQHRSQLLHGQGLSKRLLDLARNFPNVAVYVDSDVIQELGEMEPALRSFILVEYVCKQRQDWPEGLKFPSQCLLSCMRSIRYADPVVHAAYLKLMEQRQDLAKDMNGVILYGLCKCDTATGMAAIKRLSELPDEWTSAARVNASAFLYQKVQELCGGHAY